MMEWLERVMIGQSSAPATKAVGVVAYALATILCLHAARSGARRQRVIWGVLAAVEFILLADVRSDAGISLANQARDLAGSWYQERGLFLPWVLAGLSALLLGCWLGVWWMARPVRWPVMLGLLGAGCSLLAHLVRAVSWHQTDMVIHQTVGPVMVVGWWWVTGAGVTGGGAVASGIVLPKNAQPGSLRGGRS